MQSVAPAKMLICLRFEPELGAVEGVGHGEAGEVRRASICDSVASYRFLVMPPATGYPRRPS